MESDTIINEAKAKVGEHEITKMAEERAEKLVEAAKIEASQIKAGSREYADELLKNVQEKLTKLNNAIEESREQLK